MNACIHRVGAFVVASALTLGTSGCFLRKPQTVVEEENAGAFSELDKNASGESSGQPAAEKPPKGPVFPAPFTADQIRVATKNGRTYRYRVEVPKKPSHEYSVTFRNVDSGGAEVHVGYDHARRLSWLSLQQDAEFPKDKVKTRVDHVKTPGGSFDCVVYRLEGEEGEVWTYFFAKKLPGAPVHFYVERNGKRLRTTTLVQHIPGK
jgi:hypothetical protein